MKTTSLRKVSIIAERVLRDEILDLLRDLGATGWTITAVEGQGSRGVRASEWEGRSVQIDTLVTDGLADKIMQQVADTYFTHWGVIVYSSPIEVMRGGKYGVVEE